MLSALLTLFLFQLAGEITVALLRLPVPGPVVGMMVLLATLTVRGRIAPPLRETAEAILAHLPLLFVPAAVGVVAYLGLIARDWLPIVLTLIASTAITLVVTAHALAWLVAFATPRRIAGKDGAPHESSVA